ncbi:hypothetical protein NXS19_006945 [Fusarium pseudograminearum]|nr:hypothetical protein NXS19_006945 [Fusarium pseudograminearum]
MAALASSSVLLTLPLFFEEHQVVEQEQSTDVVDGVWPIEVVDEEQSTDVLHEVWSIEVAEADVLGGVWPIDVVVERPIDALGEEQRDVYQSLLIEVLILRKGQRDV